jgi:aryl-alcohol dehydrogenase-like predicted oxidoreductase
VLSVEIAVTIDRALQPLCSLNSLFASSFLKKVSLGTTRLTVSHIGFGAMHFDTIDDEAVVGRLLNDVLDQGVTLIDTARGYGRSEERIGRHLRSRRGEFVLSTKVGYGIDGVPDWTYECIVKGVERALRVLHTDVIDIVFLHSCSLATLEQGEVTQALADCVGAGKVRVAGYSGENAELAHALVDSRFAVVQASASLVDQANISQLQHRREKGALIKRSLAGLAWQRETRPQDFCEGEYWDRWQALALPDFGMPWSETALRFAAFESGGDAILIGSSRIANIRNAMDAVARGPLPRDVVQQISAAWKFHATAHGAVWTGVI